MMDENQNRGKFRAMKAMTPQRDLAVSPVVGVMLMLVVVIIIAAVVSGFAGSLVKGTVAAPTLSMDVKIQNTGYYATSFFKATVNSVDAPIRTSDLRIVTTWNRQNNYGNVISGGAVITPGQNNFNVTYAPEGNNNAQWTMVCPQGDGPGVGYNGTETANGLPYEGTGAQSEADIGTKVTNYSWFGNYALQAGTVMYAQPFGATYNGGNFSVGYGLNTKYAYVNGTDSTNGATYTQTSSSDEMQAVLGSNWNVLRPGDIVNVKIVHIPSGKIIWQADVPVEGSVV
jgi:FlaG/FlaF family flagellin (archaellin)